MSLRTAQVPGRKTDDKKVVTDHSVRTPVSGELIFRLGHRYSNKEFFVFEQEQFSRDPSPRLFCYFHTFQCLLWLRAVACTLGMILVALSSPRTYRAKICTLSLACDMYILFSRFPWLLRDHHTFTTED